MSNTRVAAIPAAVDDVLAIGVPKSVVEDCSRIALEEVKPDAITPYHPESTAGTRFYHGIVAVISKVFTENYGYGLEKRSNLHILRHEDGKTVILSSATGLPCNSEVCAGVNPIVKKIGAVKAELMTNRVLPDLEALLELPVEGQKYVLLYELMGNDKVRLALGKPDIVRNNEVTWLSVQYIGDVSISSTFNPGNIIAPRNDYAANIAATLKPKEESQG